MTNHPSELNVIKSSEMRSYDSIVIGTGQSGPSMARRLVAAGQEVAVIERKFFGGTCVNTGCTPTKTLLASAQAAFVARRHADFGVTIGGPIGVDMRAVNPIRDATAFRELQSALRIDGTTLHPRRARGQRDTTVMRTRLFD